MKGKHLLADVGDAESIRQLSQAIAGWDSLLSIRVTRGDSLYDGVRTMYGLSIGLPTTLTFADRRREVTRGDAVVLPPAIRVSAQPPADFLWICYEGLAPEHLRGSFARQQGFDHFPLQTPGSESPQDDPLRDLIPAADLRYRVPYQLLEAQQSEPHARHDATELCFVLDGQGTVRVGPSPEELSEVPLRTGNLIALGPGLYRAASPGLRLCILSLFTEMTYRRRVREATIP